MSRRAFFACLAALSAAPLIVGCGGDDTSKKTEPTKPEKPKAEDIK